MRIVAIEKVSSRASICRERQGVSMDLLFNDSKTGASTKTGDENVLARYVVPLCHATNMCDEELAGNQSRVTFEVTKKTRVYTTRLSWRTHRQEHERDKDHETSPPRATILEVHPSRHDIKDTIRSQTTNDTENVVVHSQFCRRSR